MRIVKDAIWLKYPQNKPTLGFGLYPVKLTGSPNDFDLKYYHPKAPEDYRWQEELEDYTDLVTEFLDITLYPDIQFEVKRISIMTRIKQYLRRR